MEIWVYFEMQTSGFGTYAQWQLLLLNAANCLFILKKKEN